MKKIRLIAAALLLAVFGIVYFIAAPNLNPLYPDGLACWAVFLTVSAAVLWGAGTLGNLAGDFSGKVRPLHQSRNGRLLIAALALPWAALVVVGIYSSVLFHSAAYRDQIPTLETRTFSADVQPIDITQLPVVDQDLATLLADKMLGEKSNLGSQVTLGDPTIQQVNGKLVWVVPLEDSGFFKWLSNLGGTPGYIVIAANDPSSVTYVDSYPIKYQPNAYLLDNLSRHARLAGGEFTGLTDYSFEIDDTGRPYWVVTTYKNRVGFSLPEATGALIIDAGTGAARHYTIADMPKWVDRIQPADFIGTQLNNRGKYIHGIFNFSNKDKFETSDGHAIVYNNGRCYYFTGMTSVGSDESATGLIMANMVTKETYLYRMSGATEYAAQKSAEGKVQNFGYTASFPLITNVDGKPTYFMTLKDRSGLIKQYAFVSVKDYTAVGTGDKIADALDDYRSSMIDTGSGGISAENAKATLEGTVGRISAEQRGGSTVYEFILKEQPGTIFTATYDMSAQLALTAAGDRVKITYFKENSTVISVDSFRNETLGAS